MRSLQRLMIILIQGIFKLYRWAISPWLGNRCRYVPTCSDYAHQALSQHGVFKGLWLTVKRISRCHPWGGSGYDPVPEADCQHCHKE